MRELKSPVSVFVVYVHLSLHTAFYLCACIEVSSHLFLFMHVLKSPDSVLLRCVR